MFLELLLASTLLVEPRLIEAKNIYEQRSENSKDVNSRQLSFYTNQTISWYGKGKNKDGTPFDPTRLTTACWSEFKKGTRFKVTFNNKSVVVTCTDRGHFREMGRMLDLSSGAFRRLAPLSTGIIRGATVEVLK